MGKNYFFAAGLYAAGALSLSAVAADVKLATQQSASSVPTSTVGSPSMGYVVGPRALELRAILGVPGAARFSDPMPLPPATRSAEMAPGQAWALLIRASDAAAYLPASQVAQPLPGGVPTAWAFSPTGTRLALWNRALGQMTLVSGLPGAPRLESTLQIPQPDAFAIGDTGSLVYVTGGQIYTGSGQSLYQSLQLGPVAFEATRDAIVLFDGSNSSLLEIDLSNPSPRLIAAGFGTPDHLFAASDQIFAGSSSGASVWTIDYATGLIAARNVSVSRIVPCGIPGTMLVSYTSLGPAWLVNAQGVSFVPSALTPADQ